MKFASTFAFLFVVGCSGAASPSPTSVATAPEVGTAAGGGALTAAQLYGACQERVEGSSTPGECHTDADCSRAGCSQEVCVPAREAAEVMSTCERLPCFNTLDTCGCHEGVCSWTLKEAGGALKPLPGGPGSDAVAPAAGTEPATVTQPQAVEPAPAAPVAPAP